MIPLTPVTDRAAPDALPQPTHARKLHVTATVTADFGEAGLKIQSSRLQVTAEGLEGVGAAQFPEVAKEAEGRCPVSNALRGSLKIDLEARAK